MKPDSAALPLARPGLRCAALPMMAGMYAQELSRSSPLRAAAKTSHSPARRLAGLCALAAGSQQSRRRIVLGMLLFTPLALALSFLMISSATNMGLVNIPQELKAAMEQQQEQAP